MMNPRFHPDPETLRRLSRRKFLGSATGLGAAALATLLGRDRSEERRVG